MKSISRLLLCLMLLLMVCPLVNARTIKLCKGKNLQKQLIYPNATYVVRNNFDLKGSKIQLPQGSTLEFKKGYFKNGEIEGDSCQVVSDKRVIFRNVTVAGSWKNRTVYSDWFDFCQDSLYDNRNNFRNLTTLCNGNNHTDVFVSSGTYWASTNNYECAISIPSNTTWNCKATIKAIPNSYDRAPFIIIFKARNVVVSGGVYVGDLRGHIGDNGEWSHGIECRASSNVKIKNVMCKEFWGDGIDVIDGYDDNMKPTLNCNDVTIENVICKYNRRSGISIEAVTDCSVLNSTCQYNGSIRGTGPKAGICIEAWSNVNEKIKNIQIVGCNLLENVEWGLFSYANGPFRKDFVKYNNNILIKNCKIGCFFVSYTNGISLDNCDIRDSKGYEHEYVKNLKYVDSKLKGVRIHKMVSNLPQ